MEGVGYRHLKSGIAGGFEQFTQQCVCVCGSPLS